MAGKHPGGWKSSDKAAKDETSDTEGHGMMIDPSVGRDLQRSRNKDIERDIQRRQREKEARGR